MIFNLMKPIPIADVEPDEPTATMYLYGREAKADETPTAYIGDVGYVGAVLPHLPKWDREKYPYAYIGRSGEGNAFYPIIDRFWLYVTEKPFGLAFGVVCNGTLHYSAYYIDANATENAEWIPSTVDGYDTLHAHSDPEIWANYDIYEEGSETELFLQASEPIPFEPVAYSYNGTVLPPLPEWDKTAYPYAVLDGSWDFYASSAPMTTDSTLYETVTHVAPYLYADFSTADMAFKDLENRQTDGTSGPGVYWSNHTVLGNNGNVRCEASDPIPVILPLTLFDGEVATTYEYGTAAATIDIAFGFKVGDKIRITFNGVTADYIARKEGNYKWQLVGNNGLNGNDSDGVDDGGELLLTYPHLLAKKWRAYFYTRTGGTYNLKIELIESEVT